MREFSSFSSSLLSMGSSCAATKVRRPGPAGDGRGGGGTMAAVQRTFVVPLAVDARGALVGPRDAAPGVDACPGGAARVVLRAGPIRVRHFAPGPGSCSTETALHAAAK